MTVLGPREFEGAVVGDDRERTRQVRRERPRHADRPRARTSPTVRRAEGLVQVDVQGVETHVAGSSLAEDRVQIGTVAVRVRADRMDATVISTIFSSNSPSVFGFVSMNAATSSSSAASSASRSTSPRSSLGMVTVV